MRTCRFFTAFGLALVMSLSLAANCFAAQVPAAGAFTAAQQQEIEQIVRNLLVTKDPGIVIDAARAIQQKDEAQAREKSEAALKANFEKIVNAPLSPVGGNPKGDVTVIEFFDYNCPYCHKAQENLQALRQADPNIRFIYKEFPIFGDKSVALSKIALASSKQGKYEKFHEALMTSDTHPLTEEVAFRIAKTVGLDVERLKKDKEDPQITEAIKQNIVLARELGANGTPAFIIGSQFFAGLVPVEVMKQAVATARAKK